MRIILLFISLLSFTFDYSQRIPLSDLELKDNLYTLNGTPYTGNIYELYKSGQLKSEYEVNDGKKHGTENIYFVDNSYSNDSYKDTLLIQILDVKLGYLNKKISQLQKVSSYEYKIWNNLKYNVIGWRKLYKYRKRYNKGKLKNKKLDLYKKYLVSKNKYDKLSEQLKNTSPIRDSLKLKFSEEEKKSIYKNQLEEIYTYHEGNQTGLHQKYDESKIVLLEEELKDGVRNGSYKRYENGKIKEEGTYLNDKKNGEWTFYNQDILFEIVNFKEGEKSGLYKKYNGDLVIKEGGYQNGIKGGVWKEFDDSGNIISESVYLNDTLNGVYKKYNGEVAIEEGEYSNGLMNGEWIFRHNNGNIKGEGKYVNGDGGNVEESSGIPKNGREGNWVLYHENGNKKEVGSFVNGISEGKFVLYNKDGYKFKEGKFKNGLEEGKFIIYDDNGNKLLIHNYRAGIYKYHNNLMEYYNKGTFVGKLIYKDNGTTDGDWVVYITPKQKTEKVKKLKKVLQEMVENYYCEYDCKVNKVWLDSRLTFKNCYTILLQGEFQNKYGAYKKKIYAISYSFSDSKLCGERHLIPSEHDINEFEDAFIQRYYSSGLQFTFLCDCE